MYSSSVCPVHATIIGYSTCEFFMNFLIFSEALYPSIIGIEQSIKIKPYDYFPSLYAVITRSRACQPVYAVSIIDCIFAYPDYCSIIVSPRTLYGSSSTIIILLLLFISAITSVCNQIIFYSFCSKISNTPVFIIEKYVGLLKKISFSLSSFSSD